VSAVEPIVTHVGHYSTDELRFRGRRVFAELLGRSTIAQIIVLGLSGKTLEGEQALLIDDIITAMSSADPRLWPFKITRLASAFGVGTFGVGATLIGSHGGIFGGNRMASAARWLVDLHAGGGNTISDDEIDAALARGGQAFGVLHRARDERLEALMRQVAKRGRDGLPFVRLCAQAMRVARERHKTEAHVYLGIAALCLDLGLSPEQIGMIALVNLFLVALANATEGALQQSAALQRLPTACVDYQGVGPRRSPLAQMRSGTDE
jgi:hypothetical protein